MKRIDWLSKELQDEEFQRVYAREELVEGFLEEVLEFMEQENISRSELAERMGCSRANITQLLRRTRNLTAETMSDIAFYLHQTVNVTLGPREATVAEFGERGVDKVIAQPAKQWKFVSGGRGVKPKKIRTRGYELASVPATEGSIAA